MSWARAVKGSGHGELAEVVGNEAEEREGRDTVWIARDRPFQSGRADTAVSIEREVVSGHDYAILASHAVIDGRCEQVNRRTLSVDGVNP